MHVRGVIGHEVEDDANATLVQRLHQSIKVLARAENWIYVDIVGNVVAEISHRRGIDRRDPDGVDAEPAQVVDPIEDAIQVADPVGVAVLKRTRINLIDDRLLPPRLLTHGSSKFRNS